MAQYDTRALRSFVVDPSSSEEVTSHTKNCLRQEQKRKLARQRKKKKMASPMSHKRYGTALWLLSPSSQQHGANKNWCTPRMEANLGLLSSQDDKIHPKEVSLHRPTHTIVARKRRHGLAAAFRCPANMDDNNILRGKRERYYHNVYAIRVTGALYENDSCNT